MELDDAGIYEIMADNGENHTSRSMQLIVTGKYQLYYIYHKYTGGMCIYYHISGGFYAPHLRTHILTYLLT